MTEAEFREKHMSRLTAEQTAAVEAAEGAVLLLAVPGSGKTTVLVTRLGYLCLVKGASPERTLTVTYTVAATEEMRERFGAKFGSDLAQRAEFRTINGLASLIIGFYSRTYRRTPPVLMESEAEGAALVRQLYREETGEYPDDGTVRDLRSAFTYIKNMLLTQEEIEDLDREKKLLPGLYARYVQALQSQGKMDYDDQLTFALTLLQKVPAVLSRFREKYRHISVDEAQDTSRVQHEIIRMLSQGSESLFMVGDEDQSIYSFRAAWPEALLSFRDTYPEGRVLLIEDNFRSRSPIVEAADAFIQKNRYRYKKSIHPTREGGEPVALVPCRDREAQYRFLCQYGRKPDCQTAVLYRNNDSAVPLMDLMDREGIEYSCRRFEDSFFTSRIVSDVSDIIRFAFVPTDGEIFLRIYYKISCRLTKEQAQAAAADAGRRKRPVLDSARYTRGVAKYTQDGLLDIKSDLERIKTASARDAVAIIRSGLGYGQYAQRSGLDLGKLEILSILAGREKDALSLLDRLGRLRRSLEKHENRRGCPLILSTIHSAKGLEFDRVFLMDVADGILPSPSQADTDPKARLKAYEEERRLFYVAMTRAKEELYLLSAPVPSEFRDELRSLAPTERPEETDIFAPLAGDCLGRSYQSAALGRGVITARWRDSFLIEFADGARLMTLADMAAGRLRSFAREKAPAAAGSFAVGTRVEHLAFGEGIITSVEKGIASIKFSKFADERRFVLASCIENGMLSAK